MKRKKHAVHIRAGAKSILKDVLIDRYAELLKALANPARLRIVNILAQGERTVTEICELAGLKQSLVSQQLKILRLNGIVKSRKEVPHIYYSLKELEVVNMLNCLNKCGSE